MLWGRREQRVPQCAGIECVVVRRQGGKALERIGETKQNKTKQRDGQRQKARSLRLGSYCRVTAAPPLTSSTRQIRSPPPPHLLKPLHPQPPLTPSNRHTRSPPHLTSSNRHTRSPPSRDPMRASQWSTSARAPNTSPAWGGARGLVEVGVFVFV